MAAAPQPAPQPASTAADRFLSRIQSAWQDLNQSGESIARVFATIPAAPTAPATLLTTRDWYEQSTRVLLVEPVGSFLRLQPLRRVLEAMRTCDQEGGSFQRKLRSRLDRRFQRVLILAALDLCEPWRIWRGGDQPAEWQAWQQRRAKFAKEASTLLAQYRQWAESGTRPGTTAPSSLSNPQSDGWWRKRDALLATLKAELTMRDLTLAWFGAIGDFINDTRREREELQSLTSATLAWLETGSRAGGAAPESIGLTTPEERLRLWAGPIETAAAQALAERVELLVAGREPEVRPVALRASFTRAFGRYARTPMRSIVDQCWGQSAAGLRQVEQAKEMIAYWSDASSLRGQDALHLMEEARHHAIAALNDQLQASADASTLEERCVEAFWIWHQKGTLILEAKQYGWIALRSPL